METNIDVLIQQARDAQAEIEYWPQEKVDLMVAAVGWETYKPENAERIAALAIEETGMGLYEHKLLKHQVKTIGVLRDLAHVKSVGIIEEDVEKGLIKIAKPIGVIGALTPVTNCEATLPLKALPALKCRNAIVFAPHPHAKRTATLVCETLRAGLKKAGAPENLIQTIEEPSIDLAKELMSKVDLVLATGGGAMVKSAYSSGTPAFGVGAGNAVVIVDESADLAAAAEKIYKGKTFDLATSCSSENSIVVQESIYAKLIDELKSQGGYFCNESERELLKNFMWPDGVHLNKDVVAQPVEKIAKQAGLKIPDKTTFLMVKGKSVSPDDPFCKEKLSVVLTVWKYQDFDEAISFVSNITDLNGRGHSCGIHSTNEDHILALSTRVKVSRIMVNQPQSLGNSGNFANGMPFTLTLGCGSWGGNISTENLSWKHFMNVTWVSKPIEPVVPEEEQVFGAVWENFGK